jgi:hypothetical protein
MYFQINYRYLKLLNLECEVNVLVLHEHVSNLSMIYLYIKKKIALGGY